MYLSCFTYSFNCIVFRVTLHFDHILSHEEFSTCDVLSALLEFQNVEGFRLQIWDFQIRDAQVLLTIQQNLLFRSCLRNPSYPNHENASLFSKDMESLLCLVFQYIYDFCFVYFSCKFEVKIYFFSMSPEPITTYFKHHNSAWASHHTWSDHLCVNLFLCFYSVEWWDYLSLHRELP